MCEPISCLLCWGCGFLAWRSFKKSERKAAAADFTPAPRPIARAPPAYSLGSYNPRTVSLPSGVAQSRGYTTGAAIGAGAGLGAMYDEGRYGCGGTGIDTNYWAAAGGGDSGLYSAGDNGLYSAGDSGGISAGDTGGYGGDTGGYGGDTGGYGGDTGGYGGDTGGYGGDTGGYGGDTGGYGGDGGGYSGGDGGGYTGGDGGYSGGDGGGF